MTKTSIAKELFIMLLAIILTACASRGDFVDGACAENKRISVYGDAVSATYFDIHLTPIAYQENLDGTLFKTMCPIPGPGGGSGCPAGTCPYTPTGSAKTYCLKC